MLVNGVSSGEFRAEATPMDIAPTVLRHMGVTHDTAFLAGRDMRIIEAEDEAERERRTAALESWNWTPTVAHINTQGLSADLNLFQDPEKGEVIFDLQTARMEQFHFHHQIENAQMNGQVLVFDSTGIDPHFLLPELPAPEVGKAAVSLTIESKSDSVLELFYASDRDSGFSESYKQTRNIRAGENQLLFALEAPATRNLRIDPGTFEGQFVIKALKVRVY